MRILHLVRIFGFGGAENHVRDLANVLDEMGHEVFIMARSGKQNDLLNRGVKFINIRMNDLLAPLKILFVARFVRENGIEVIHAHQRLPVFIGCMAGKITGVPVIVTVHGQTQYDVRSVLARKWIDKFIFVRQSTFDEAKGYGIALEKSLLIQNGVRIANSQEERDYYSLCYISRIDKRHSQVISMIMNKVLIHLCGQISDLKFNIAGDGDHLNKIRIEAESINRQLGRTAVIILGYMPDVREVIRKSGLVLGVGRVAIETLACGVPVLSVNQKYFGGLVSRENYSFFQKNNFVAYGMESPDENKLSREIQDYFSNIKHWQDEATYLQKQIDKDFNILKIASGISDLYRETIGLREKKII
jgi:glycosyltransferase involved in cell wall biosynthesis